VQLLQVVNFRRGRCTQAILNRFNQLSLNFLILNPDTSIVAAIELDDATRTGHRRHSTLKNTARLKSVRVATSVNSP
jgi:hypothetical protein